MSNFQKCRRWVLKYWPWLLLALTFLLIFLGEWVWLDNLPTALTELQYAGNQNTASQVVEAWGWVGITRDRIQVAVVLDIFSLLIFAFVLAWAVHYAAEHFRDGAHEWKNKVLGGTTLAALCGLLGDCALNFFLSSPLKETNILTFVFFVITLKTILFSAVGLYVACGFAQSWWAGGFWDAVRVCGFSVFAAFAGPGLLTFGHQGTAIFAVVYERLWPEDKSVHRDAGPYCWTLIATLFFSLMCWGAARYAVSYKEAERKRLKTDRKRRQHHLQARKVSLTLRKKWLSGWKAGQRWVPRFCGLVPSLLIVLIIILADPAEIESKGAAGGIVGIGGLVAGIIWVRAHGLKRAASLPTPAARAQARKAIDDRFSAIYKWTVGVGSAFVVAGCLSPYVLRWLTLDFLRGIGPLAAWFFSFSVLVPFFTFLVTAGRRSRKPLLALVLAYGFLINAADLNDDHGLRYQYGTDIKGNNIPLKHLKQPALNDAFDAWLASDKVKEWRTKHPGQPYPVLFVAAAGGGIVAGGVFTATMAELHQNPNTPQAEDHLFAISGVSGGSVGAVTYAVLRDHDLDDPSTHQFSDAAKKVMTSDMLSPTVASLLGPEMIQRFLPVAVPNVKFLGGDLHYRNEFAMDRGRAVDLAFEAALTRYTSQEAFPKAQTMLTDYPPPDDPKDSRLPVLFLNTTCVETGQRMVISTVRPDAVPDDLRAMSAGEMPKQKGDWPLPFETLYDVDPRVDLPLSTAACLSARFPVVSPPAFLPQWRDHPIQGAAGSALYPLTVKRRYVDGGYYENSGVETAMDVIDALRRQNYPRTAAGRIPWRPVLIAVHMDDTDTSLQPARADLSGKTLTRLGPVADNPHRDFGFDEIAGPAEAFFNGWGGPSRPELMRTRRRLRGPDGSSDFIEMSFPRPVILSWYLSEKQYGFLQDQARMLLNGRQGRRLRGILEPPEGQRLFRREEERL